MRSWNPKPIETPPNIRLEELFAQAAALPRAERAAWLDGVCAGQPQLRAEVEDLLRSHETRGFLDPDVPSLIQKEIARLKPEEAGERIGNYRLLEQIGEGGFGTVWVAEQDYPIRRRVALKIIKLGMDTKEVIARFEQERQALAMMDHPNIAKVHDAGATEHGRPYFVMELVRGMKITEYCDQAKLATAARLELFIAVCHAVQHAHQKGIIHRDLKPSNILVTLHDGVPVPKVIDFGVAKATQSQRRKELTIYTKFEQLIGTPLYMSPEQAEMSGLDIDTRSDIYSLGVLLYELLTGRTPFDPDQLLRRGLDELRRAIREQEPQKPSTILQTMAFEARTVLAERRQTEVGKLLGQVRGDLDWIVMKALEKDRSRRYDTAIELAKDIRRHLAAEPVNARPPSRLYRVGRMVSRNRLACAAGAAVFCSMAFGLAVSYWQMIRAKTAERDTLVTLRELRETAPAFATHARMLADKENFAEAIVKLDYAIKLRPDVVDYVLSKANLLQCQFQFGDAARAYRKAASVSPGHARALANAALSDELASEVESQSRLSRKSLVRLSVHMANEARSPAEMLPIGRLLGVEKDFILGAWRERLKQLPLTSDLLASRLEIGTDGLLSLDLSGTRVSDLSPLEGMPLARLNLDQCRDLTDLSPLRGLPLKSLSLFNTSVVSLAALSGIRTLVDLDLGYTEISDLTPLHELPIERLEINGTQVLDLTPLKGMPLQHLTISDTRIDNIASLKGMPLVSFDCQSTAVRNGEALAGAPMTDLNIGLTEIAEISFLRGMPLRTLNLHGCRKLSGIESLLELTHLESLILPATVLNFSREDILAVGQLRRLPSLRKVGITHDMKQRTPSGKIEEFWTTWDENSRCVLRLREAGVPFKAEVEYNGSISVSINGGNLTDLSILEGAKISALDLRCPKLTDLKQLASLPLQVLRIRHARNVDLALFANLSLEVLLVSHAERVNIAPLRSSPLCDSLEELNLENLTLSDFSPVAACSALKLFSASGSPMLNLEFLRGRQLNYLYLGRTNVEDLSPIAGMPLREIYFDGSRVTDVSPLLTCPTLQAIILPRSAENTNALRELPHLRRISYEFDSKLGAPSETVTEFWGRVKAADKLEIPLREVKAKPTSIDLSKHYNADFNGNWHGDVAENDLSSLPAGVQILAGTEFDCRGIIQLRNGGLGLASYPAATSPVPLHRRCSEIHFLHGCIKGDEAHGTEIAQLRFRFVDGSVERKSIVLGHDVLDWWKGQYEAETVGPKVAWTGTNGKSRRRAQEIRLFKSSWQNPHPQLEVESLEFVSSMSSAAPFVVAITVEP